MTEQALQEYQETVENFSIKERLEEMYHIAVKSHSLPDERFTTFCGMHPDRSPSSLIEMILSRFKQFSSEEEKLIDTRAQEEIEKLGHQEFDWEAYRALRKVYPDLAVAARMLGHIQLETEIFLRTVEKIEEIISSLHVPHVPSEYVNQNKEANKEHLIPLCFDTYPDATEYASTLFHLLRHSTTLTGAESVDQLSTLLQEMFDGKNVVEVGCGPGYFLKVAQHYGARVLGIDSHKDVNTWMKKMGIPILDGLASLNPANCFDLVISKNFFSTSVMRNGKEIITELYKYTEQGGLHVHQIKMETYSEIEFITKIKEFYPKQKDQMKIMSKFSANKWYYLQKHHPNISENFFDILGYEQLTQPRVDPLDFLTYVLRR